VKAGSIAVKTPIELVSRNRKIKTGGKIRFENGKMEEEAFLWRGFHFRKRFKHMSLLIFHRLFNFNFLCGLPSSFSSSYSCLRFLGRKLTLIIGKCLRTHFHIIKNYLCRPSGG